MRLPFKMSISTKLLIVISSILLSVTVPLAFKSANLFKNVSIKREESANLSHANAKANEINIILKNLREKSSIMGSLIIFSQNNKQINLEPVLRSIFSNDENILSIQIFSNLKGSSKLKEYTNTQKLVELGAKEDSLFITEKNNPFPIQKVINGETVILNRSDSKTLPVLTLGFPLFKKSDNTVSHFAVIDLNQSVFQKIFSELSERKSFLINQEGKVLAHYQDEMVLERKDLSDLGIVSKATSSKISQGTSIYTIPNTEKTMYAAFSHANAGPIVVSEIAESIILEPSQLIRREVFYITGLILSISLIIIFLFSLTLTQPIIVLSDIAKSIGQGKFDIPVVKLVNSTDEVGSLASSVENMIVGLKERDKAKSILNKFHGSSVAQDLLSSTTIERQGVRRNVAILFCDIRGFTSMSEKMEPEEVVLMLNDYLNTMVQNITINNGIIDKFIGDAIMAIWGTPQPTGTEAYDAVKAALEMRQALIKFNETRIAKSLKPLRFGIGLHYGPCVSGIIGSEERLEYSVIGDTVNVCSRIESMTKSLGVDILVTSSLYEKVADRFVFEVAEAVTVKGKEKPILVYKVLGYKSAAGESIPVTSPYATYEKG